MIALDMYKFKTSKPESFFRKIIGAGFTNQIHFSRFIQSVRINFLSYQEVEQTHVTDFIYIKLGQ